jgi:fatty-acyl-CoA synthase
MVYTSLREGQNTSEEELLAFAADHVLERAAVPKQVVIVDALPLTAVGKIYKPDLRRDAFRRVLEADLAEYLNTGAVTSIEVVEDKKYGQLARISLATIDDTQRAQIRRIVSRYPIETRYD